MTINRKDLESIKEQLDAWKITPEVFYMSPAVYNDMLYWDQLEKIKYIYCSVLNFGKEISVIKEKDNSYEINIESCITVWLKPKK